MASTVIVGPVAVGRTGYRFILNRHRRWHWLPRFWRTQFGQPVVAFGRLHLFVFLPPSERDPNFPRSPVRERPCPGPQP